MNQLLSIDGDKLIVEKLRVKYTEGPLIHAGEIEVVGTSKFNDTVVANKDINVKGTITADTINVKHIICDEPGGVNDPLVFTTNTEKELEGRGFHFADGNAARQFVYKSGNRMWSTMDMDLSRERVYKIENIPVLSMTELGSSIVKSNLKSVGELDKLKVAGSVEIAEYAFFNPVHNRLGINTDNPNGTIGLVENNVDIVLGSYKNDFGYIGTFNNTGLEIGTDNTSRITIKNTGEINIGHSKYKNAVVRIHGRLEVDEIVNDPRAKVNLPLTFKATDTASVYGTGIVWFQNGTNRDFTYAADPDRIRSSEIIDLDREKWYSIDKALVLSKDRLGDTVRNSNLSTVGVLENLQVAGDMSLGGSLTFGAERVVINNNVTVGDISLDTTGLAAKKLFTLIVDNEQELKVDSDGSVEIGNRQNTNRNISLYGQVSVNATNPDPDVAFTVGGIVKLNNKKFVKGSGIPTTGRFSKGDICWNDEPEATAYIGWVCVREGTPGEWLPFGRIAEQ